MNIIWKSIFCLLFINVPKVLIAIKGSNLPPVWEAAKMARFIINKSDWTSVASISSRETTKGYPFVSLKSLSDGPLKYGTGVPYLYLTEMDVTGSDLKIDNRCTIMASVAENLYCKEKHIDPEDPRCAKVMLTGKMLKLNETDPEYSKGKDALFAKHPAMVTWPTDHDFYVAKLDIMEILVLDFFGGIKNVSVKDYYKANEYNLYYDYIVSNTVQVIQIY